MTARCSPGRRLLARGPVCAVEECACGVLHVTLGVVTLRLDREVFESAARTFASVLRELGREEPERSDGHFDARNRVAADRLS